MDAGRKRELEEKVYAGVRLSRVDGEALYASDDLVWLGRLAHHRRTGAGGDDRVLFVVNRQLKLTDLCAAGCAYCSFRPEQGEKDPYPMPVDEAVRQATELAADGLTELELVNPVHPALPWQHYPELLRALTAALPDVRLTGFAATELRWLERNTGLPADEILDELVAAGLASLSGGGAEIFDPEVRQRLGLGDRTWEDWSRIHRLAHAKGLGTPATMRFGHVEEPRHRVDHVLRLRELQDETGGFTSFLPLRYEHDLVAPAGGGLQSQAPAETASPAESLKTFAVSRLLLDNVPHLTCCWATQGPSVAQLALHFGVDDLAGAAAEHRIGHAADPAGTPAALSREELLQLVWDADLRPAERDSRYAVLREYDAPPSLAERRAEPQQVWA
ncbi:radical SAM protein [Plantactinospora sp. KLBMP9567]|uniref:radical SAM protein n=1 Tax=Plantactinospora sp. KLBMP9567 TaxID=3085900 RepID=UPI002982A961|nr:radical SAM protein [Plantactinospora sp. KLBMP9567]MDW5329110.1 radical SAM protein [Plantactinospora sp. KLBMP9567]MDW5329986.1 radical SAM protein [Plantactinospora sp. KLBMP9567]